MSRWGIEGFFAKLKQWRRIANRYDKLALAASFSNHRRINAMHAVHQDSTVALCPGFHPSACSNIRDKHRMTRGVWFVRARHAQPARGP